MESSTYTNAKVIEASKDAVFIVAHYEVAHGSKEVDTKDRGKVKICKVYPTLRCEEHRAIAADRCIKFFGSERYTTPHHIWCGPDGKELGRESGFMGPSELIKALEGTLAQVQGPKLGQADYDAGMKLRAEGEESVKRQDVRAAIVSFTKLSKAKWPKFREMGEQELQTLDAQGEKELEEAREQLETNPEEACKVLRKIASDYKPLACSKKAADLLKDLDRK